MLHLAFKKRLTDFDLQIDAQVPDGLVALFGPSGAGKTTTLQAIAGLVTPDAGEIRDGEVVLFASARRINLPPHRRDLGCVFQEGRLFPHLSVEQNLRFGLEATPPARQTFGFDEIVEVLQLQSLLDRRPATCSAGQQQRVALGRALLASPRYLLMDEPLAAVDVPERWRILAALREMHRRHQLPVLYVSHDPGTVLNFAEHMLLLRAGRIEDRGEPMAIVQRVMADPRAAANHDAPIVQNLFAAEITQQGRGFSEVRSGRLLLHTPALHDDSGRPLAVGSKLFVQIAASEILLATREPVGLSARNIFPGHIVSLRALDHLVGVEVEVGERIVVEVLPTTVVQLALEVGARVFVIIKASGIRRL